MKIDIYPDGDQICACIGSMPEETAIGFGDTIFEALEDLYDDMTANRRCARCFSDKIAIQKHPNGSTYLCECGYFEDSPRWEE
jgi:hypothetical protein